MIVSAIGVGVQPRKVTTPIIENKRRQAGNTEMHNAPDWTQGPAGFRIPAEPRPPP